MMVFKASRLAIVAAGAGVVLGVSACNPQATQEAQKAEVAKAEKTAADERAQRQVGQASECLSALRWKRDFLSGAGVGSVDLYVTHYRGMLERALGDASIPAENGAPALTRATIDPYLEWAYTNDVTTKFTAGRDFNNDGTTTPRELNARGYQRVVSCIQQAAETGVGPLAKLERYPRFLQIKAMSERLEAGR